MLDVAYEVDDAVEVCELVVVHRQVAAVRAVDDVLIAASVGQYDAAEYARQLEQGV